jgi:hypothetical protein
MIAIGILNVAVGALGAALAAMVLWFGHLAVEASGAGTTDGRVEGLQGLVVVLGTLAMIVGAIGLPLMTMLTAAGVGVLFMARWGQVLSMACGCVLILMGLFAIVTRSSGAVAIAFACYGLLLVGLFCQAKWRAAFGGQRSTATGPGLTPTLALPEPGKDQAEPVEPAD